MYFRLLGESLRRGTRRKLLAISSVALGTLGATALGEVVLASGDRLAAEMSSYGANVEVVPGPGRETLPLAGLVKVRNIFWKNNIAAMAPFQTLRVRMSIGGVGAVGEAGADGAVEPLVGTWFDHALEPDFRTGLPATRPTLHVAGRWPRDEAPEVVLGQRLARRLGLPLAPDLLPDGTARGEVRAALGDHQVRLRVVGLLTSGGEEDDQAFTPLAIVHQLAGQKDGFTRAEIFALTNPETQNRRDPKLMSPKEYDAWYCTAYPSSVAFQIHEVLPEAQASVVYGVTGATADVLKRLSGVLFALAVVALAGAVVGVTAAMTATVLERRLEAGLLVAIGAPRRQVVFFFLSEAAFLGLLGGVIGGLGGLGAGRLLGSQVLGVTVPWLPILLPFAALLGLVVAVLASIAPVLRALGRYPAAILKQATA